MKIESNNRREPAKKALPNGFRVRLETAGPEFRAPLQGFQLAAPQNKADSATLQSWEHLSGRVRSPPSVVSEYETLASQSTSAYGDEFRLHIARIAAVKGLHREAWLPVDWRRLATSSPPSQPVKSRQKEEEASRALAAFHPTFWEQIFGAKQRRTGFEDAVIRAQLDDENNYRVELSRYGADVGRWEWFQRLAQAVLQGEPSACQEALDRLGPFRTFDQLGASLNVVVTRPWCVEAWLIGNTNSIVPSEVIDVTATGKISRKNMPTVRYWEIYQDHVCSAALRIAREVFGILPIPVVLIHVGYPWVNSRTGHPDCYPVLSVAVERSIFATLNLDAIDPSDSMANFENRMRYKRTSGFDPIEPMTPDDLGVSDG